MTAMTYAACPDVRRQSQTCRRMYRHDDHCDGCGRFIRTYPGRVAGNTVTTHVGDDVATKLQALIAKRKANA